MLYPSENNITLQHCPLVVFIVHNLERRPHDVPGIAYDLWYCLIFDPHRHKHHCGPEGAGRNAAIPSRRFLPLPNVVFLNIAPAPVRRQPNLSHVQFAAFQLSKDCCTTQTDNGSMLSLGHSVAGITCTCCRLASHHCENYGCG